jgi:hypothetical protein
MSMPKLLRQIFTDVILKPRGKGKIKKGKREWTNEKKRKRRKNEKGLKLRLKKKLKL